MSCIWSWVIVCLFPFHRIAYCQDRVMCDVFHDTSANDPWYDIHHRALIMRMLSIAVYAQFVVMVTMARSELLFTQIG